MSARIQSVNMHSEKEPLSDDELSTIKNDWLTKDQLVPFAYKGSYGILFLVTVLCWTVLC